MFERFIGMRYTRAKRKNHFISFISLTSMIGIALGVATLIVVLSVMNGFQQELRTRILGVASHLQVTGMQNRLDDWQLVSQQVNQHPKVIASAPFVNAQAMLSHGQSVHGVMVRGIEPSLENTVADFGQHMQYGALSSLKPGAFGIVLGTDLAYSLGVRLGDQVVVMAPQGQFTPTGVVPRLKQFTVVGLFEIGMYEYDAGLALINLEDAAKLYRMGDAVSGVRLKLADLFDAPRFSNQIQQDLNHQSQQIGGYFVTDWTQRHANFFQAVKLEKRMMSIILTLIVAVAAFNIVSTLVMAVTDKRADIAILKTLGASPSSIMQIFVIQGVLIGLIGTLVGAIAGVLIAMNIDTIIPFIENLLQVKFLSKDVYYISDLPSQVIWSDVVWIVVIAIVLSLVATLYPSWKASQIQPAEALRYE